jgi:hypothetical protein
MGTYREQDPLTAHLSAQQTRVLDCLRRFADGEGAANISEARRILTALAEAERDILYPAFTRVAVKPETQALLDDSRGNRAQHLEGLDALAHKRAPRLRKLAAVALSDLIDHHGKQHASLLIPVLASQLPRPLYRSIVHTFVARVEGTLEQAPATHGKSKPATLAAG